jgi:hypothetical protein
MMRHMLSSILGLALLVGCSKPDTAKEAAAKAVEAQDKAIAAQNRATEERKEAALAQAQADLRADQAAMAAAEAAATLRTEREAFLKASAGKLQTFDERLLILEARAAKDTSAEARAWVDKIRASRARFDELHRQALASTDASWISTRDQIDTWVEQMQSDLAWGETRWTK